MKTFRFSLKSKVIFYFYYIFFKIFGFIEIKKGARRIYLAELIWFMNQAFKINFSMPVFFETSFFETKFGKFHISPDLVSTITVSPAFERRDIIFLTKLVGEEVKKRSKILFVDIGANFGLYSVIVGKIFKKKVDIISFEPNTTYLTSPTFALLRKNIRENKLKNIKTYKIGIGSKNTKTLNKAGFMTKTLDSVLGINFFKKYDTVFIKLDVDDFVVDALKGIDKSVRHSNNIILLVEDFVDKKSIKYLKNNYLFMEKLTSYNSFWCKK